MAKVGRGAEQVMVRLPDGMRERLKDIAAVNGRSMNAEIIERLEQSFKDWPKINLPAKLIARIQRARIDRRMSLEREIEDIVINTIEKALPDQGALHGELLDILYSALEEVPKEKRDALVTDVREVWGKITAATRGE